MISLANIVRIYKIGDIQVAALDGITCHIAVGDMVSIMGPSGSGKSTLMNLIGCLDRPTSGTYELDGMDVSNLDENKLAEVRNKKIGFVFQSYNLLARTTALDNVELPLVYGGIKKRQQQVQQALESVGIAHRSHHRPSEMSGGEQQRVAIARALVNNPSLILADEPTGNLDTKTSQDIMVLLQNLNNQGITIIIVTHEEDIASYTQRTIYLRDGKIVQEKKR